MRTVRPRQRNSPGRPGSPIAMGKASVVETTGLKDSLMNSSFSIVDFTGFQQDN